MVPYDPPPHHFNPDDKRSYLLMVFTRTPFVPFAVPDEAGRLGMFPFPAQSGIYALYLNDRRLSKVLQPAERREPLSEATLARLRYELVYVGKTSGSGTLRNRLGIHYRKISSRQNIDIEQVLVRYLQIEHDWNVLFSERHLIEAPEIVENPPPRWNTNGFGSNVPGRGRPGYRPLPENHFDLVYPRRPEAPPDEPEPTEEQ